MSHSFSLKIHDLIPGLKSFQNYDRSWFPDDLRAALSVVAVALPVAIAYAQLAGVNAIAGLYACVLPMIAYAFFGTSRQLIVGPDAATCAVIAAVVTPLAAGDSVKHLQLVVTMTIMTGLWCLIASRFKLGVLADFLSRPILMGLLNGVAITIIVGQFAKITGVKFEEKHLLERIYAVPDYLASIHWPTVGTAAFTLLVYLLFKRFKPTWPAAMLAIAIAAFAVFILHLDQYGIAILGDVKGGLPTFSLPVFDLGLTRELVMPALNLAMVSFVSMMLTARSFAARNGYEIDADKEFRALGIANLASALSQGFAISGADSRTAVNDASGGKSQLVSIIAAIVIGVIALFVYEPLRYIPHAALGVILVISSISLLDFIGMWALKTRDRDAFLLATITFVAVLIIGVIPGITLAVLLGLFQFIRVVMRPSDQTMGLDDKGVLRSLDDSDKAAAIPGVFIYRFNSPLTYFNAAYFKRRLLQQISQQETPPTCVIIDAVASFTHMDVSVMAVLDDIHGILKRKGMRLILAGRKRQLQKWCELAGMSMGDGGITIRSDMYLAIKMSGCYRQAYADGLVAEVKKNEVTAAIAP
ncbi:SulP family inorganic anion transporter [Photobacterium damselae]|nr:SulP family inorganic anion transporter [Photobacterium damselae]